jgi:hypothetical protein
VSEGVNKGVARRLIEVVWNDHDLTNIDEFVAANHFDHAAVPEHRYGIESARHVMNWLFGIFPDHRFDIKDVVADGDRVAIRGTCTGTHEGDLWGNRRRASVSLPSRCTGSGSQRVRWPSIGRSGTTWA